MGGWFSSPRQQQQPVQQAQQQPVQQAQQQPVQQAQQQTIAPAVEESASATKKKKKTQATQTQYAGGMLGSSEIANINTKTLLGQ